VVVGRCHPIQGSLRFVVAALALTVAAALPGSAMAAKYKVLGNGHLKFIGRTPDMAVPGTSGMAGL
jgi:hypothetical protein